MEAAFSFCVNIVPDHVNWLIPDAVVLPSKTEMMKKND